MLPAEPLPSEARTCDYCALQRTPVAKQKPVSRLTTRAVYSCQNLEIDVRTLLVCAGLLLASGAQAGELKPVEAASLAFGEVSGIAYFTQETNGYRVVATLSAQEGPAV